MCPAAVHGGFLEAHCLACCRGPRPPEPWRRTGSHGRGWQLGCQGRPPWLSSSGLPASLAHHGDQPLLSVPMLGYEEATLEGNHNHDDELDPQPDYERLFPDILRPSPAPRAATNSPSSRPGRARCANRSAPIRRLQTDLDTYRPRTLAAGRASCTGLPPCDRRTRWPHRGVSVRRARRPPGRPSHRSRTGARTGTGAPGPRGPGCRRARPAPATAAGRGHPGRLAELREDRLRKSRAVVVIAGMCHGRPQASSCSARVTSPRAMSGR